MIFLLWFLLVAGVVVNSLFSLKPLSLSALLYPYAVFPKYSLLQGISGILLLTIDGIYLVMVGGWFACLSISRSWLLSFCMDNFRQFLSWLNSFVRISSM